MIKIKIDNRTMTCEPDQTILEVANKNNIEIPTLCYLKEFGANSSCRICLVEVDGQRNLVPACSFKVFDGMSVSTNSKRVLDARKINLELLMSNHHKNCINCIRNKTCELQYLFNKYNCDETKFVGAKNDFDIDMTNPSIVRDPSKCILCRRCINACNKRQKVYAISQNQRGFATVVTPAFNDPLKISSCVGCGQCILACPTGALYENPSYGQLKQLLKDKSKYVVVAPAPAVRVGLGEEFGLSEGTNTESILPSVLKSIGFFKVFDINFAADLTICEEGKEFIERLKYNGPFPMFTSCCPAWIDFADKFYPSLKKNISTCKSPQQMFGSVVKTYFAQKENIDPKNIVVVSIMPCTAKKAELGKDSMQSVYGKDVDLSITVRELAIMLREKNVNLNSFSPTPFDNFLGESSGAGVIFGNTGGVMEAALRSIADILSNKDLKEINYKSIRGLQGVKTAKINVAGKDLSIAIVSGLGEVRDFLNEIKKRKTEYHFIEIMSCPGGCINGGGMPRKSATTLNSKDIRIPRNKSLYDIDQNRRIRKSHKNPEIIEFYKWQNSTKNKAILHIH